MLKSLTYAVAIVGVHVFNLSLLREVMCSSFGDATEIREVRWV